MSLILPCLHSPFGDRASSEAGSRSGGRARDPHGPRNSPLSGSQLGVHVPLSRWLTVTRACPEPRQNA